MRRFTLLIVSAMAILLMDGFFVQLSAQPPAKKPFTFEDMMSLKRIGGPSVSPDGKWVLFAAVGSCFWYWVNSTSGAIFISIGVVWALLELALGPTAASRVRITGVSVDLPLVKRTRRAGKVLEAIDAAVRASRDVTMQPAVLVPLQTTGIPIPTNSEAVSATPSLADASATNGF